VESAATVDFGGRGQFCGRPDKKLTTATLKVLPDYANSRLAVYAAETGECLSWSSTSFRAGRSE
jgi:hypothetical protein